MKTKIIAAACAVLTILSLTACQPTPEQEVVVKKDSERMLEQASSNESGTELLDFSVPETYLFEYTGANGKLNINVNAKPQKPDKTTLPIVETTVGVFTQEQVTGMFNYLFPDEKPRSDPGQVEIKADFQAAILELQKSYKDGNYEGSEADYKAELERLQELYKKAPDSQPDLGEVSDGTMKPVAAGDSLMHLNVENDDYLMKVNTYSSVDAIYETISRNGTTNASAMLLFMCKDPERSYSARNDRLDHFALMDGSELPPEAAAKLTHTPEDAQALCEGLFEAAGYDKGDFVVKNILIYDNTGADEVPGSEYAYCLTYERTYSGLPLFSESMLMTANDDSNFTVSWYYENIEIIIDNEGIASVKWYYPIEPGNAVNENATLLPFDQIQSVFEGMVKTSYEGVATTLFNGEVQMDIEVTSAELSMIRIREQGGGVIDGLIVPAWIFKGSVKGTHDSGEERYLQNALSIGLLKDNSAAVEGSANENPFFYSPAARNRDTLILAINAIDGSIIDISKGY